MVKTNPDENKRLVESAKKRGLITQRITARQKRVRKLDTYAGKHQIEKRRIAHFGGKYNATAASIIQLVWDARLLEAGFDALDKKGFRWPGVFKKEVHQIIQNDYHLRAWDKVASVFATAVKTGDGTIFRQIAEIIELSKKPDSEVDSLVGDILQICDEKKIPIPTVQQFVDECGRRGIATNFNQVKRILARFEVTPSAGKVGRPKL